jgi:hypothetical protein
VFEARVINLCDRDIATRRKKKRKKHTSNGLQKFPHLAWEVLERYTTQVNPTSSNNSNYMNGKRKKSKWLLITLRMKIWVLKKYKSISYISIDKAFP